jgi:hypothetical protein
MRPIIARYVAAGIITTVVLLAIAFALMQN